MVRSRRAHTPPRLLIISRGVPVPWGQCMHLKTLNKFVCARRILQVRAAASPKIQARIAILPEIQADKRNRSLTMKGAVQEALRLIGRLEGGGL